MNYESLIIWFSVFAFLVGVSLPVKPIKKMSLVGVIGLGIAIIYGDWSDGSKVLNSAGAFLTVTTTWSVSVFGVVVAGVLSGLVGHGFRIWAVQMRLNQRLSKSFGKR